jgi:hypothetical protein
VQREENSTDPIHETHQSIRKKWCKPVRGVYKVNCVANLSVAGTWGLGAVIGDEDEEVMAAATWKMCGFDGAATAEAMRKAMEFAQQCCFTQVEMESNSALFFIIHFTTVY